MIDDPAALTATEALARLRSGSLSAVRLAQACLDRVATREALVRAWVHLDPDLVLARARALDAASHRGPLHGLPVGVKDVIHTCDMPTRHNSPLHAGPVSTSDAACVAMLRRAGAIVFGKTATVEFAAIGSPAATRNPHDPARTPGGSSSGSAAAVADRHVPLAIGTQTGGSIIRPASFCGVWAMKPTWGRISNEGCKRFAPSLDSLGWFARGADDLALVLEALDPQPAAIADPPAFGELRIAVCRTPLWARAEPATQQAFFAAEDALRRLGFVVETLEADELLSPLPAVQRLIMRAEGCVAFQPERGRLEGAMAELAEGVDVADEAERLAAGDAAATARAAFDRLAAPFDAVLVPSAVGEAPEGLGATGDFVFNGLWTLLHAPCVNVPGWRGPNGSPVGLSLVAPRCADRRLLGAARAIARALKV